MVVRSSIETETVQAIMTADAQTVDMNSSVANALRLMSEDGFSMIPVVDSRGKCVGILSRSDLTETLLDEDRKLTELLEEGAFRQMSAGFYDTCSEKRVREVMTHDVLAVSPNTPIKSACEIMFKNRIHHVPVISSDDAIAGILSSFDVIGWVAEA